MDGIATVGAGPSVTEVHEPAVSAEDVDRDAAIGDPARGSGDDPANSPSAVPRSEADEERLRDVGESTRGRPLVEVAEDDEHRRPDRQPGGQREDDEGGDDPPGQAAGTAGQSGCRGGRRARGRAGARRHEPVAEAADGLDRRPVGPELPADLGDVDIDRPRLAGEVGAPDVLEEGVAGEDDAGVAGERREQVELAGAQLELAVADRRLAPARIDPSEPTSIGRPPRPVASVRRRIALTRATSARGLNGFVT